HGPTQAKPAIDGSRAAAMSNEVTVEIERFGGCVGHPKHRLLEGSYPSPKENGGAEAPPFRQLWICVFSALAEERQHWLVGLRGRRQRGCRQRLAGVQGEQVGTFLVGVGHDEVVGAGLQRVEHGL